MSNCCICSTVDFGVTVGAELYCSVRVIGGWQNMADEKDNLTKNEDILIARAYRRAKHAVKVEINAKTMIIDGSMFGRIVSKANIADGLYRIMNAGRPGKSQVFHIAKC